MDTFILVCRLCSLAELATREGDSVCFPWPLQEGAEYLADLYSKPVAHELLTGRPEAAARYTDVT